MLSRAMSHARANAVAYMALFVALGGTSYAAVKLPRNSVKATQIATGAVRSAEVKDRSLLAKDFKRGQLPVGPRGATGAPGAPGAPGANGGDGAPATRLWARVRVSPTPALLGASGVVSVINDPGFPGEPNIFLLTFDRDVSACAFQATPVGRGGGASSVPPSADVSTGFYPGSSMTSRQIRVTTFNGTMNLALDFDVAAFC